MQNFGLTKDVYHFIFTASNVHLLLGMSELTMLLPKLGQIHAYVMLWGCSHEEDRKIHPNSQGQKVRKIQS